MNGGAQVKGENLYKNLRRGSKRQQMPLSIPTAKMCNVQQTEQSSSSSSAAGAAPPATPPTPTSAYALFQHREQLRRRKPSTALSAKASVTKIKLTSELISRSKQNISKCSFEDLQIMARQTLFKKSLQRHLHYRRMQLQHWLMAKKAKSLA